MITLTIYPHNLNGSGDDYICQNLFFRDFYVGMKRDETDLMVIRKYCDGDILLRNPVDFDTLSPYFSQEQDAHFYYENSYHWCRVSFKDANYSTKSVVLTLKFIDNYSYLRDGVKVNSHSSFVEPLVSKELFIDEFGEEPIRKFIDGSSYMEGDLWGTEEISVSEDKDVDIDSIWVWNNGGDEVSLENLVVGMTYQSQMYIPTWVKYTDKSGGKFRHCQTKWKREFRYFPKQEQPKGNWRVLENVTQEVNGIVYVKYYRMIDGDGDKWFTQKDNYFIRDESEASTPYMTAEYQGYSDSLQKSPYFYDIYDLFLKLLITGGVYIDTLFKDIYKAFYIASLRAYNEERSGDRFKLETLINLFRDKFGIYFWYDGTYAYLDYFKWTTNKFIDIDNYRGFNFLENKKASNLTLPRIINFESNSERLDFGKQQVSFDGYIGDSDTISENVICDPEDKGTSQDSLILINAIDEYRNQIYEQFRYDGIVENGTEAIFRSENGKYISWNHDRLESGTYIDFKLISNNMYVNQGRNVYISFGYVIYKGSVKVSVENINWTLTAASGNMISGTKSGWYNISGGEIVHMVVELLNAQSYESRGFLYNIKVEIQTKVPSLVKGIITDLYQRNGSVCLANTIRDYQVPMSYSKGNLKYYGSITPKTRFNREIEFTIPLSNVSVFDTENVFQRYIGFNNEKYCIFERKRQILTETQESQFDNIIARTNDVY